MQQEQQRTDNSTGTQRARRAATHACSVHGNSACIAHASRLAGVLEAWHGSSSRPMAGMGLSLVVFASQPCFELNSMAQMRVQMEAALLKVWDLLARTYQIVRSTSLPCPLPRARR